MDCFVKAFYYECFKPIPGLKHLLYDSYVNTAGLSAPIYWVDKYGTNCVYKEGILFKSLTQFANQDLINRTIGLQIKGLV